jgi:hypothetical protein
MNRKFHKICRGVVSSVERGGDECWRQRQHRGTTYFGGSNEWWWQWRKNCNVGEFLRWLYQRKRSYCRMGCHYDGNASRFVITDVISVCTAKMCLVMKVLLVRENDVMLCMHLWFVDPPCSLCFQWMPSVHFKFEKTKGKYALSFKTYKLGEKIFF